MVERIRALLVLRQLTPTQFADLIQVGRPIVSHVLSGRNKASLEVVQRIIAAFPEIALPWLLNGIGPMLNGISIATISETPPESLKPSTQRRAPKAEPIPSSASPAGVLPAQPTANIQPASDDEVAATPPTSPSGPISFRAGSEPDLSSRSAQPSRPASQRVPPRFRPGGNDQQTRQAAAASRKSQELTEPLIEPPVMATPSQLAHFSPETSGEINNKLTSSIIAAQQPATIVPVEPLAKAVDAQQHQLQMTSVLPADIVSDSTPGSPLPNPQLSLPPSPKRIRRIVIFYQDDSFADFYPE